MGLSMWKQTKVSETHCFLFDISSDTPYPKHLWHNLLSMLARKLIYDPAEYYSDCDCPGHGLFQAMMPVIGWAAGLTVRESIERYDHWIAFGLLTFVGVNMIREAFKMEEGAREKHDPTRGLTLVMLSVATSIDALAVGLTISMLRVAIWLPALVIGLVAGAFTVVGLHLGKSVGAAERLSPVAEILGGLVLLGIGIKVLIEHKALAFLF